MKRIAMFGTGSLVAMVALTPLLAYGANVLAIAEPPGGDGFPWLLHLIFIPISIIIGIFIGYQMRDARARREGGDGATQEPSELDRI